MEARQEDDHPRGRRTTRSSSRGPTPPLRKRHPTRASTSSVRGNPAADQSGGIHGTHEGGIGSATEADDSPSHTGRGATPTARAADEHRHVESDGVEQSADLGDSDGLPLEDRADDQVYASTLHSGDVEQSADLDDFDGPLPGG